MSRYGTWWWGSGPGPKPISRGGVDEATDLLNSMGAEGWELVNVVETEEPGDEDERKHFVAYFKKRRPFNDL